MVSRGSIIRSCFVKRREQDSADAAAVDSIMYESAAIKVLHVQSTRAPVTYAMFTMPVCSARRCASKPAASVRMPISLMITDGDDLVRIAWCIAAPLFPRLHDLELTVTPGTIYLGVLTLALLFDLGGFCGVPLLSGYQLLHLIILPLPLTLWRLNSSRISSGARSSTGLSSSGTGDGLLGRVPRAWSAAIDGQYPPGIPR